MVSTTRDGVSQEAEAGGAPLADRRRAFVAREIEQAALQLFDERGFEAVTIPEIAAAAGVSRSTFFRYFSSKEHLLRARSERLAARVVRALQRRPADESAFDALRNAFLDTVDIQPGEEQAMFTGNRVLTEARRLPAAGGDLLRVVPPEVAPLLAARMGVDPAANVEPHLLCAVMWSAADVVTAQWIAQGGVTPLHTMLQDAFRELENGFGRRSGRKG